jgi:GNAT superfamily N-acetyltransferase
MVGSARARLPYCASVIRPLHPSDAAACDAIVASLPAWFGMEEGTRECAKAVRTQPGLVAEADGDVVGFLTLARPYPHTPEISWMAVRAGHRRRGSGRALIEAASERLRAAGDRLVIVKTLSDREDPGPEYAETRAFYLAMGFVPVAELYLHPDNPMQLLALPL